MNINPFGVLQNQLKMNNDLFLEQNRMLASAIYTLACGGIQGELGSFKRKEECNHFVKTSFIKNLPSFYVSNDDLVSTKSMDKICFSVESLDEIIFYALLLFAFFYTFWFKTF